MLWEAIIIFPATCERKLYYFSSISKYFPDTAPSDGAEQKWNFVVHSENLHKLKIWHCIHSLQLVWVN